MLDITKLDLGLIQAILERGNTVEIFRTRDGISVFEIRKKVIQREVNI